MHRRAHQATSLLVAVGLSWAVLTDPVGRPDSAPSVEHPVTAPGAASPATEDALTADSGTLAFQALPAVSADSASSLPLSPSPSPEAANVSSDETTAVAPPVRAEDARSAAAPAAPAPVSPVALAAAELTGRPVPRVADPPLPPPAVVASAPLAPVTDVAATAEPDDSQVAAAIAEARPLAARPRLGHLPAWVQVRETGVSLWSAGGSDGRRVRRLPMGTFLRVLDAEGQRLHVRVQGGDAEGASGWVGLAYVQPAEPGEGWRRVVDGGPVSVFGGQAGEQVVARVAAGDLLRALDAPRGGRVAVRVYTDAFDAVAAEGWVRTADLETADPPSNLVYLGLPPGAAPPPFEGQVRFIARVGEEARDLQAVSGVPASVTVAQAILESDWGRSRLAREAHNYFGMKALGGIGSDGVVWMETSEFDESGELYDTVEPFRAYRDLRDSLLDHARAFTESPGYAEAMEAADDPDEFARRIAEAGYSTDPEYPAKLSAIMARYDLYRFDR